MVLLLLSVSTTATSQCMGSNTFSTCTDNNGNNYNVQRYGNTTSVQGSNASTGSTWSQNSTTMGNMTRTTGQASNGAAWTENRTELGGGNYVVSGTNSQGQSYSHSCNKFGCN